MATTQRMLVTGDGSVMRVGNAGWYVGTGQNAGTADTDGPFWSYVDDYPSNTETDWIAWAVDNAAPYPALSFTHETFTGPSNADISKVEIWMVGYAGQSGGAWITPSGDGNNFNLGYYLSGSEVTSAQTFLGTSDGWTTFTSTFTTKQDSSKFTATDIGNLQPLLSYGYYWITTDKSYTINDNAHNIISSIWLEVTYTIPSAGGAILLV
jgi:hypothetical protein